MTEKLRKTDPMPVLFVGHGSPMNAIEENEFSQIWSDLGKTLPIPQAILCNGDIIHNLRMMQVPSGDFNAEYAYDWATEFNAIVDDKIIAGSLSMTGVMIETKAK